MPLRLNKSFRHCALPLACETFSLAPIFGKITLYREAVNPKRHSVSLSSRESQPHPLPVKIPLLARIAGCHRERFSRHRVANLAVLKLKGWTDAKTTAIQTVRDGFGPSEQYRIKSISGAKDTTVQERTDAATLYDNILTIQNAADLEWPATTPPTRASTVNFCSAFSRPTTAATTLRCRLRPRPQHRANKSIHKCTS